LPANFIKDSLQKICQRALKPFSINNYMDLLFIYQIYACAFSFVPLLKNRFPCQFVIKYFLKLTGK